MSTYSIRDLERLSNQKAHTIRMWEQRYGLLEPLRTDTNIRYYDDDQLKKLLNVCTLMSRGMKISRISKLGKQEMSRQIDAIIAESSQGGVHAEAIIHEALIAIATYDAGRFHTLYQNAVASLGLKKTYLQIIHPLLVRTGLLWIKDDLLPAQEHFLSNLVRQKLFAAIESLPLPAESAQTWLLFLHEEEDHEIGLLFASYLLQLHGRRVIYLGTRVPYQDLHAVARRCSPTHFYTFFVRNQPVQELQALLNKLATDFPDTRICFSGSYEEPQDTIALPTLHIKTIDDLTNLLSLPNE